MTAQKPAPKSEMLVHYSRALIPGRRINWVGLVKKGARRVRDGKSQRYVHDRISADKAVVVVKMEV